MKKRFFVEILREICEENGYDFRSYSEEWLLEIVDTVNNRRTVAVGYNLDLNSGISNLLAQDKVLTSTLLSEKGVYNVKHFQISSDDVRKYLNKKQTQKENIEEILEHINLPIVVKPTQGMAGQDVYLCHTQQDIDDRVAHIARTDDVCLSEYIDSKYEYRIYMLDHEPLFLYRKDKRDDWRHNLSLGAIPEVLNLSDHGDLVDIARRVCRVMNLGCSAIDFLVNDGVYTVLEVNNGISMTHFAAMSSEYRQLAKDAHIKMLEKSLK
jgi:glutathione synthase/RimK-type ligase-like ATP-grasp enzyme